MQGCRDVGGKIKPGNELRGLKEDLTAVIETGARIHRKPEGPAVQTQFVVSLDKFGLRKFADGDFIAGGGALEIDIALRDKIDAEVRPVLGHEADRMRFREDSLIERFRELLPEGKRGQIIELAARLPSVSQIILGMQDQKSTAGGGLNRLLIFESIQVKIESGV